MGGRIHDLDIAGRPDAITQLAALAAVTDRIGLVSTSNVTFNEPADLARRLAGLDLLSGGRADWNVVTTDNAWTGENFRRGGYLDHADRYRRAEQVLRAARAIWDGWADGAFGARPDAPSWLRPGSVRAVEVHDDLVDIEVTPTLPRSAQGHPVIFQAGDSSEGRDFAARNADVIFSAHGTDFDDALAFARDIRLRLRAAGRPEDDLRILPGTQIVIGATEAEAQEKAAWVRREQVTPRTALAMAGLLWGGRPSKPERGNGLVSDSLVAKDALDDGGVLGRSGSYRAAVSMDACPSRAWTWAGSAPPWRSRVAKVCRQGPGAGVLPRRRGHGLLELLDISYRPRARRLPLVSDVRPKFPARYSDPDTGDGGPAGVAGRGG